MLPQDQQKSPSDNCGHIWAMNAWQQPTNSSSLRNYFSLVNMSMQELTHCFIPEALLTWIQDNLIG